MAFALALALGAGVVMALSPRPAFAEEVAGIPITRYTSESQDRSVNALILPRFDKADEGQQATWQAVGGTFSELNQQPSVTSNAGGFDSTIVHRMGDGNPGGMLRFGHFTYTDACADLGTLVIEPESRAPGAWKAGMPFSCTVSYPVVGVYCDANSSRYIKVGARVTYSGSYKPTQAWAYTCDSGSPTGSATWNLYAQPYPFIEVTNVLSGGYFAANTDHLTVRIQLTDAATGQDIDMKGAYLSVDSLNYYGGYNSYTGRRASASDRAATFNETFDVPIGHTERVAALEGGNIAFAQDGADASQLLAYPTSTEGFDDLFNVDGYYRNAFMVWQDGYFEFTRASYASGLPGWSGFSSLGIGRDMPTSRIRIAKTASDSGEALSGATFAVIAADGSEACRVTTDENGEATTKRLDSGSYTIREVVAPAGYKPAEDAVAEVVAYAATSLAVEDDPVCAYTVTIPTALAWEGMPVGRVSESADVDITVSDVRGCKEVRVWSEAAVGLSTPSGSGGVTAHGEHASSNPLRFGVTGGTQPDKVSLSGEARYVATWSGLLGFHCAAS